MQIYLGLNKFGVDLDYLQPDTVFQKQIFYPWIEYWESSMLKKKYCLEK